MAIVKMTVVEVRELLEREGLDVEVAVSVVVMAMAAVIVAVAMTVPVTMSVAMSMAAVIVTMAVPVAVTISGVGAGGGDQGERGDEREGQRLNIGKHRIASLSCRQVFDRRLSSSKASSRLCLSKRKANGSVTDFFSTLVHIGSLTKKGRRRAVRRLPLGCSFGSKLAEYFYGSVQSVRSFWSLT
jgi:hypothetical protein